MPGGMKSFFLHFSCLQQSFIDRGNGIDGQFIIFHGFFDVLLEAGMTENTVAQNTNWNLFLQNQRAESFFLMLCI